MNDKSYLAETGILAEVDDGIAVITLNRPERLNAVTHSMQAAYVSRLWEFDGDPAVRVIIVTGAGRGFCSGADFSRVSEHAGDADPDRYSDPATAPDIAMHLRKPVIAAVNGAAAGLGLAYVLATDIRFVEPGAKLDTTFARLGLAAEFNLPWLLPRTIGLPRATELLMSARPIDGVEAEQIGLVNFVSQPGQVLQEAMAYARRLIATTSPASWAAVKEQLLATASLTYADALSVTYRMMAPMLDGADHLEAVSAYLAKRPPAFTGLPVRE
jgi:enoyl-CoA hydratase/carnithine racemase